MRTNSRCRTSRLLVLETNVPIRLPDTTHSGVQQDLNPVLLKNLGDFFGDIRVFAGEQLSAPLNNRHAAAETPEELSKLRTDVATAQDQKMLGNSVEFHHGHVVQRRNVVQAIHFRPGGAGTGIDKDIFGGERALSAIVRADVNRRCTLRRITKPGLAENQLKIRSPFDARLAAVAKFVDNVALALANSSKIDTNIARAGVHSIIGGAPCEIGDSSARPHRVRRSASVMDAGSAHMFSLDQSSVHPGCRKRCRERRTCLPGADDDGIVLLRSGHRHARDSDVRNPSGEFQNLETSSSPSPMATRSSGMAIAASGT